MKVTAIADKCPDCGVGLGKRHRRECDIQPCTVCGHQRLFCCCEGHDPYAAAWAGEWPDHVRFRPSKLLGDLTPEFELGTVFVSTMALRVLVHSGVDWAGLVRRHATGDFGKLGLLSGIEVTPQEAEAGAAVTDDDGKLNKVSLLRGRGRIHSIYGASEGKDVWVITDFDGELFREISLLLESEY